MRHARTKVQSRNESILCLRDALCERRTHNGTESRLARAADLARAAVEKECPAELLEAAFGLPRCVAMLLSCVIVLRLLIALAAEVCWRSKCAQAAASDTRARWSSCPLAAVGCEWPAGVRALRAACRWVRFITREMVLRAAKVGEETAKLVHRTVGGPGLSEEAF